MEVNDLAKDSNSDITITPLGGVGEIGKNMMLFEMDDEMIIIDSGIKFPEDDLLGIDLVIPDFTYVMENKDKVKAIVLTHGHLDHIGALPYLLKELDVPVYGTKLTLGLLQGNLKEHNLQGKRTLKVVTPGQSYQIGSRKIEFIKMNHSIADTCALAIHTPEGPIVYASDFKFDQTPIDGEVADFHKLAELGDSDPGVLALFSDSTNAEREGYTLSEKVVGGTIDDIFRETKDRIVVATFASNIHRVQQIADAAMKYNRKIALTGRSMLENVKTARELGYLTIPEDVIIDTRDISNLPDDQVVLLTTGSQGEPMAALTRMARGDHYHINTKDGDTVIISARAIPGNEKVIGQTINQLTERGANVIFEELSGVHVSGHASQEELKLMMNLTKPKYFLPTHGEYRHMDKHADLAKQVGIPEENIYLADVGDVIKFGPEKIEKKNTITSGDVLVDGLGVGDVGNIVLRDRKMLSEHGILIVVVTIDDNGNIIAGPDIITRGFVYIRESEKLISDAQQRVREKLRECEEKGTTEWSVWKSTIKDSLKNYIYSRIHRKPMIMPIIMEI